MIPAEISPTHLVFVRHAESLLNRDGPGAGQDSGLTELGWQQAQRAADWLAENLRPHALVCSSMTRSRQTAEVIGQRLGLTPLVLPGLEEAPETYWDELAQPASDPLALWDAAWPFVPERAPVYTAFRGRIRQALAHILKTHAGRTVVVVCHGGVIATVLRSLFGGQQMLISTENTGITQLTWREGRWRLVFHNSHTHLGSLMPRPSTEPAQPAAERAPWTQNEHLQTVVAHFQAAAQTYPHVGTRAMEKRLQAIVALAAPGPEAHVLDLATGTGLLALAFAPQVARVVGVDVSPAMLERAEQARIQAGASNVHFRWADAVSLPFADGSFDLVVCRDLLPYLAEPERVLVEITRVLAPGGKLVIDEIAGSEDPVKRATQDAIETRRDPAMLRVYTAREIERFLSTVGFCIERREPHDVPRDLDEWLDCAAATPEARSGTRAMLEAAVEGDAAGIAVRWTREGTLSFTQHWLRVLAATCVATE